jgi:hypothetical protein
MCDDLLRTRSLAMAPKPVILWPDLLFGNRLGPREYNFRDQCPINADGRSSVKIATVARPHGVAKLL